jgi:hypothetical protein
LTSRIQTSLRSSVAVLCLVGVLITTGCTPAQKKTVYQIVQKINAYEPAVVAALESAAATIEALDPAIAPLLMIGVPAFNVLAKTFEAATTAYLASPNATTLQALQAVINTLQTGANTAAANALHIENPVHQALAIAGLKQLLSLVSIVFGLISATETTAQLQELASRQQIQLAALRPYMDEQTLEQAVRDEGAPRLLPASRAVDLAFDQATAAGF